MKLIEMRQEEDGTVSIVVENDKGGRLTLKDLQFKSFERERVSDTDGIVTIKLIAKDGPEKAGR